MKPKVILNFQFLTAVVTNQIFYSKKARILIADNNLVKTNNNQTIDCNITGLVESNASFYMTVIQLRNWFSFRCHELS